MKPKVSRPPNRPRRIRIIGRSMPRLTRKVRSSASIRPNTMMLQTIRKMAHPVSPVVNSQIVAGSQISTGPTGTSVRKKQKNPSRRAPGTPAIRKPMAARTASVRFAPMMPYTSPSGSPPRQPADGGAAPTRQPFQHGAERRSGARAVTIQEEGDQQADDNLHHTGADQGAEGQNPGTRDLNIGFQLGGRLNAA